MKRIAIVNRGEAASRCIRAIKELRALEGSDLTAIVLYTEPDTGAPFVRQADVALSLGAARRPARNGRTRLAYLDHTRVLAGVRASRADAVWPGWGFLAEDAEFVAALEERGITFLGPPSDAIRNLGDKIAAKRLAESVGVPVLPWSQGPITGDVAAMAGNIGFPLIIKASAGGGGRGIRIVRSETELAAAIASARSEAHIAFANDTLFCEAFLQNPRHIEAQIAADNHGGILCLGLRDCSVQRRHQKVLEEAPPASLAAETASAMEKAAVELTRAAAYRGVGTVEFLLADDGRSFYFLEVNPRLQVEHAVTEAVTGVDLVALQIRIGRDEAVPATAPSTGGHAVEVRLCAEDVSAGFAPAPGRIELIDMPTGPGIRNEHSATAGTRIPAEFDSLIAKVIAHASDRKRALARLRAALGELRLVIAEGATNKGFLLNLLDHADIQGGAVDIHWLDRRLADLSQSALAPQALIVAAILTYLGERALQRLNFFAEVARGEARSIPPTTGQSVDLSMAGNDYRLHVLGLGNWRYRVDLDQKSIHAVLLDQEPSACQLAIDEERYSVEYTENAAAWHIEVNGHRHTIDSGNSGAVRAAAPSVVVAIDVETGDHITAGQRLGVLEAMKIETPISSPISGVVTEVRARIRQNVAAGDILLVVVADAGADAGAAGGRITLPELSPDTVALADAYAEDRFLRERARRIAQDCVRRVVLGYDCEESEVEQVLTFLDVPPPQSVEETVLRELAEIRSSLDAFAATEILFSRQPNPSAATTDAKSNDAMLRAYLRRSESGSGGDPSFEVHLTSALNHYGIDDSSGSEARQRALLRLFAARRQRRLRYRVVEAVLRHLGRLIDAGLRLTGDEALATSLGTCIALRGETRDSLADAALEVRSAVFEAPEVERRTRLATDALESTLAEIDPAASAASEVVQAVADSAPRVFDLVVEQSRARADMRMLALQAIVARLYAPARIERVSDTTHAAATAAAIHFDDGRSILATLATSDCLESAWQQMCDAGGKVPAAAYEMIVSDSGWSVDEVRALGNRLIHQRRPAAPQTALIAMAPGAAEICAVYDDAGCYRETNDLHPETRRRLGLDRLSPFTLERLDAPAGVFVFFARSRQQPRDERLFVFGEVHAAVPGSAGTLHEASFLRVFAAATRALRRVRSENPDRQRLYWNRLTISVRPAFHLTESTLRRLLRELLPTTRHLGLERIIVRLSLLDETAGGGEPASELVIEPVSNGEPRISWRPPQHTPILPADRYARRLARARQRNLVYPYEAIRLLTGGERAADRFEEHDLDAAGSTVVVADRAPGENECAIVFGISTAFTTKLPEGMQRVTVLSDPTIGMAALARPECDRIVAALDLATERGLPVEWFATSAGARIAMDSGTENLDAVADVVRRIIHFTRAGGEINIVVCGTNVGAQSYFDALSTMLMHTRGILIMMHGASMILTGKRALDASGGTSAEDERDIGGYEDVMGPNGQAQCFAADLEEAIGLLMRHYELTYVAPGEHTPRRHATADRPERRVTDAPSDDGDEGSSGVLADYLGSTTNPGRKMPFSIRPVMRALMDRDSVWMERWAAMRGAQTAVVWDTHMGGHAVCMIGVENRPLPRDGHAPTDGPAEWTGATLFPGSSKKIARALNSASGSRPAILLANLAGFDGSPESMRDLQLEYGAEIATAVVCFQGPILFVVMSRYHGGAYVVFSNRLNSAMRSVALRGSYASVIGGAPAATVIFDSEVQRRTDRDERLLALQRELERSTSRFAKAALRSRLAALRANVHAEHHSAVAEEFDRIHSVERAKRVGSIHEIIAAEDLRPVLIEELDRRTAQRNKG